ncbi:glycoside hydrolase family 32 protein [Paratractidigestivibacter sp.]|uniref:glycoside hydrolase family 32 protein n=1 Tax=Paratractidigestivibacter sp. TaxID=2847316 RepID=UPI002AC89781|nr:glycoside hydrolase family 32 protein [Paratractidigestivibacter sp.]
MTPDLWRMGYHLMPPTGWLNDPNGLCQFRGTYHFFHQWSPEWPAPHARRGWGHYSSEDLVHWEHHGMVLDQDTPDDANGAYSGGAIVVPGAAPDGGDLLRLYYTGNVKEPGDHDFVYEGRGANEILVESADGFALGPKETLLRNADYPAWCSCHVRDPKIWEEDGAYRMLLGARTRDDLGMMLVYRSDDGRAWELSGTVRSDEPVGYMWECPDRIVLDGHEYVGCCPQGVAGFAWSDGVDDHSGYFPVAGGRRVAGGDAVVATADFTRWDHGFEFYAPQSFVDESGRTILVGWVGMPEASWIGQPEELDWIHCLTVPRELSRGEDGRIAQWPIAELEALRGEPVALGSGEATLPDHRADLVFTGIEDDFEVALDDALEVRCDASGCGICFVNKAVACGRTSRRVDLEPASDLRILVDSSVVEVFANGGRMVFSTRWFPAAGELSVRTAGACERALAYPMADAMAGPY